MSDYACVTTRLAQNGEQEKEREQADHAERSQ